MKKTHRQLKEGLAAAQVALPGYERLTQIAFVLSMGLVVARATMGDFSRSRGMAFSDAPRGAGVAAGIGLDLLCCLPALLVFTRRVMDRQYVLRWSWAVAPLAALSMWGVLSTFWASDKFSALCFGFHLIGATALLFAGVQLVRSWLRLRMVGAILFGLLLAYFMHSIFFRLVDVPGTKTYFEEHRAEILKQQGISDPFAIKQFENKVLAGELLGFFSSANSMAAVVVLLMVVALGLGGQRILDEREDALGIAIVVAAAGLGGWMIYWAQSKTAAVTPVIAVAAVVAAWRWREEIGKSARKLFWLGLAAVVLAGAAVIGHGMFHKSLPGASLTFRWNYWVGSMRLVAQHPLAGVGLDNFGLNYLGVRLPVASEEVKDPHNFLVKYLTELGVVGAVLVMAWMLRMGWEMTRPVVPAMTMAKAMAGKESKAYQGPRVIGMFAAIAGVAMAINVFCSIDFRADPGFIVNEILSRTGMFAVLLIGATVAAIKSLREPELDARPAPLLLYAMLAALGVFVIHNLIDFSMSEAGALMLFSSLVGSVLGVRHPSMAGEKRRTAVTAVALAVLMLAWIVACGFVWVPTARAESTARDGELALRTNRPGEAMRLFNEAHQLQPLNADYAYKAAQAGMSNPHFNPVALDLMGIAIRENPLEVVYYLTRAHYLLKSPEAEARRVEIKKDFARAVELNLNDVQIRLEYADALADFKTREDRAEAVRQYEEALRFNSLLKEDEPKRLHGDRVEEIRRKMEALR